MKEFVKKAMFIALLNLIAMTGLNAQEAVSAAGGHNREGGTIISWTLGELAITTLGAGDMILSQGIHQSTLTVSYAANYIRSGPHISVYPNPAADQLHISIKCGKLTNAPFSIMDIAGRVITTGYITDLPIHTICLEKLGAGVFLLRVGIESQPAETFRIVKR